MKRLSLILSLGVVVVVLVFMAAGRLRGPGQPALSQKGSTSKKPQGFIQMSRQAAILEKNGELLAAREIYRDLIKTNAWRTGIEDIQKALEALNMRILLSGIQTQETTTYEVRSGDSLYKIAKKFHTTVDFLKAQNGLSSDVIRPGARLRIWQGRFSVLVDKSQNVLTLKSDGEVLKNYSISTGKNSITPVGTFKIVNKLVDPAWHHDGKVIPSSSPENILGSRWLGFDRPGYGIHGTTKPQSIGQQVTAGCVRMFNRDVEGLFVILPLQTEVVIIE